MNRQNTDHSPPRFRGMGSVCVCGGGGWGNQYNIAHSKGDYWRARSRLQVSFRVFFVGGTLALWDSFFRANNYLQISILLRRLDAALLGAGHKSQTS